MELVSTYPTPIITADDVRVIERYVAEGKLLPLKEDALDKKLTSASSTLAKEIIVNYKIINKSALSWESVENSMIEVSSILVAFADDLTEYGEETVALIKGLDDYKKRKISDMTPAELDSLPPISLDGEDQNDIDDLVKTIQLIKKSSQDKKRKSQAELANLESFKNTLTDTIYPWLGSMIARSNPDDLDDKISRLEIAIRDEKGLLQKALAEKNHTSLTDIFKLLTMDTDVIIEKLKKSVTVRELRDAIEALIKERAKDNEFKAVLRTLYTSMGSLYDVVTPAIKTVQMLNTHWESIIALIDTALKDIENTSNRTLLGIFVKRMEALLRDWNTIKDNSEAVKSVFRLKKA